MTEFIANGKNLKLTVAAKADVPALRLLFNAAYRGRPPEVKSQQEPGVLRLSGRIKAAVLSKLFT